jgi:HlyD family secretion protein
LLIALLKWKTAAFVCPPLAPPKLKEIQLMAIRLPRGFTLPAISAGLLVFSVFAVMQPARMQAAPPVAPAASSIKAPLAALGIVEPSSEMISIGTNIGGIVSNVYVLPGGRVSAGAALFQIDDRQVRAGLAEAQSAAAVADIAARDAAQRYDIYARVDDPRAISVDERDRRKFAAALASAQAEQARARVASLKTELERHTVTAPIDGIVYRVDVRVGEFAPAGPTADPLMALGADGPLHVRAEIDEEDISRLSASTPMAEAMPRGAAQTKVALKFVRFEPQVRAKRNLAGGGERVDTRVLEAIFKISPTSDALTLFPGQQVDVFLSSRETN